MGLSTQSVRTWVKCYSITLPSKKAQMDRFLELKTWDTSNNNPNEHAVKMAALRVLHKGISLTDLEGMSDIEFESKFENQLLN